MGLLTILFSSTTGSPRAIRGSARLLTADNLETSLEKRLADSEYFSLSLRVDIFPLTLYFLCFTAIPSLHISQSSDALEAASLDLRLDRISLVRSFSLSLSFDVVSKLTRALSPSAVGPKRRTNRRGSSLNSPRPFSPRNSSVSSHFSRLQLSPRRLPYYRIRQRHPHAVGSRPFRRSQSYSYANPPQRSRRRSPRRQTSR